MMEEFTYREAPMINMIGWGLAAGSLLVGGSHEQKLKFLPAIAKMETFWAEGLTEPDAGSDLASLQTSAVRDGDYWVVNGQKTYTTWGTHADVLYLAARTNPDVPSTRASPSSASTSRSPASASRRSSTWGVDGRTTPTWTTSAFLTT